MLHYEPLARLSGLESLKGFIHTVSYKMGVLEKHSDAAGLSQTTNDSEPQKSLTSSDE